MVHRRELNGKEIVLGNHGALYKDAMTWWDHDTGSVWSQPLGQAILGPLKGERLELLPSTLTPWRSWRGAHPETLALDFEDGSAGFELEDMLIAVELNDDAIGYSVPLARERGPVNDVAGGVPIAVVFDPRDPQRWAVFSRELPTETGVADDRRHRVLRRDELLRRNLEVRDVLDERAKDLLGYRLPSAVQAPVRHAFSLVPLELV